MRKNGHMGSWERWKCRRTASAFRKMCRKNDIFITGVEKHGYLKIQYHADPFIVDGVKMYTDSGELFSDLWGEWLASRMPWAADTGGDYADAIMKLPKKERRWIQRMKKAFAKKAGIKIK